MKSVFTYLTIENTVKFNNTPMTAIMPTLGV